MKWFRRILFALILIILLCLAAYVVSPKSNAGEMGIHVTDADDIYAECKNTLDIFAVGNSNLFAAMTPMQLWEDYGYTSYAAGESNQMIYRSYFLLKSLIDKHKPKLCILETDVVFQYRSTASDLQSIISEYISEDFPLFEYHNRWKKLTERDFTTVPSHNRPNVLKGYEYVTYSNPYTGGEYMNETENIESFHKIQKFFLDKITELCKENDIELLLIDVPSSKSWSYEKHNAIQDYADENGLKFIDFNINRDSFGIDWNTDTRDGGWHMNHSGAVKVTEYLGKFLDENYHLPDHRGENGFEQWANDLAEYKKTIGE